MDFPGQDQTLISLALAGGICSSGPPGKSTGSLNYVPSLFSLPSRYELIAGRTGSSLVLNILFFALTIVNKYGWDQWLISEKKTKITKKREKKIGMKKS